MFTSTLSIQTKVTRSSKRLNHQKETVMSRKKVMKGFWLLFLLIAVSAAGCGSPPKGVIRSEAETVDLSMVINKGNFYYLPIYRTNNHTGTEASERVKMVLAVLDLFENAHPELEIINFSVSESNSVSAENWWNRVFGVWLHCRPKTERRAEESAR